MNRFQKYFSVIAATLLAALIFAGCTERKLERGSEQKVQLTINWVDGPLPTGAEIILYPIDGSTSTTLHTPSDGYSGELPTGEYNVIVYSTDPQNIDLRSMNEYLQAQVYANNSRSKLIPPGYISMGDKIVGTSTLSVPVQGPVSASINAYQLTHTFNITFTLSGAATGVSAITGQLLGCASYVQGSTLEFSSDRIPEDYVSVAGQVANTRTASLTALGYNLSPGTGDLSMDIVMGAQRIPATLDLTTQLQSLITANAGKLPLVLNLTVDINIQGIQATATVTDWSSGSDGSGTIH